MVDTDRKVWDHSVEQDEMVVASGYGIEISQAIRVLDECYHETRLALTAVLKDGNRKVAEPPPGRDDEHHDG